MKLLTFTRFCWVYIENKTTNLNIIFLLHGNVSTWRSGVDALYLLLNGGHGKGGLVDVG